MRRVFGTDCSQTSGSTSRRGSGIFRKVIDRITRRETDRCPELLPLATDSDPLFHRFPRKRSESRERSPIPSRLFFFEKRGVLAVLIVLGSTSRTEPNPPLSGDTEYLLRIVHGIPSLPVSPPVRSDPWTRRSRWRIEIRAPIGSGWIGESVSGTGGMGMEESKVLGSSLR